MDFIGCVGFTFELLGFIGVFQCALESLEIMVHNLMLFFGGGNGFVCIFKQIRGVAEYAGGDSLLKLIWVRIDQLQLLLLQFLLVGNQFVNSAVLQQNVSFSNLIELLVVLVGPLLQDFYFIAFLQEIHEPRRLRKNFFFILFFRILASYSLCDWHNLYVIRLMFNSVYSSFCCQSQ